MAKKGRKQAFCSGSPLPSDVLTLRNTTASTATCSESIANDFVFQNHHAKTGKRVSFDVVTDAKRHQGERAYRRLCSRSSRRRVCCIPTRVEAQIPGGEPLWIHLPQNVQDHKQSEDAWWRFPSKIKQKKKASLPLPHLFNIPESHLKIHILEPALSSRQGQLWHTSGTTACGW